jgi:hypothetical protein
MNLPDENNEPLIDELIKVADYERLFNLMKDSIVGAQALEKHWDDQKIKEVKKQIKFEDVADWIFYNAYADESKAELEKLIAHFKGLTPEQRIEILQKHKWVIWSNFENNIQQGCKE